MLYGRLAENVAKYNYVVVPSSRRPRVRETKLNDGPRRSLDSVRAENSSDFLRHRRFSEIARSFPFFIFQSVRVLRILFCTLAIWTWLAGARVAAIFRNQMCPTSSSRWTVNTSACAGHGRAGTVGRTVRRRPVKPERIIAWCAASGEKSARQIETEENVVQRTGRVRGRFRHVVRRRIKAAFAPPFFLLRRRGYYFVTIPRDVRTAAVAFRKRPERRLVLLRNLATFVYSVCFFFSYKLN